MSSEDVVSNGYVLDSKPPQSEKRIKMEGVKKLEEVDPFAVIEDFKPVGPAWDELDTVGRIKRVSFTLLKFVLLMGFLYMFICSLSFLSSAFRLLGGKTAGEAFKSNAIINNSVAGLMIGVLATVLLQSSSTTTSIVVSMVGSKILGVRPAIPMVMGANIGTSVTNTIVAIGQIGDKEQFRRAFAGATVHDVFNLLSVVVLLPLEAITGYLFHLSESIVKSITPPGEDGYKKQEFLSVITNPFTNAIIQVDKKIITKIAENKDVSADVSLLKKWCGKGMKVFTLKNITTNGTTTMKNVTETKYSDSDRCKYVFADTGMSDSVVGVIMLIISLAILCTCLVVIVKILHSLLKGQIAMVIKKTFNAEFPKPFTFLTGYVSILVGAGLTMLVQSSSIFTSALTPMVGLGIVSLDRIYPLTLGANIGTTVTGILAALAATSNFELAFQIALCHLFFNISGIILFYPVPFLRRLPLRAARVLGNTTAKYRWFAVVYLIVAFFALPALIFIISLAGIAGFCAIMVPIAVLIIAIIIINVIQNKKPDALPEKLQTWKFLPAPFRSLKPYDSLIQKVSNKIKRNRSEGKETHEMA